MIKINNLKTSSTEVSLEQAEKIIGGSFDSPYVTDGAINPNGYFDPNSGYNPGPFRENTEYVWNATELAVNGWNTLEAIGTHTTTVVTGLWGLNKIINSNP